MPRRIDLDSYDTRILAELQADARLSMAELGRRVHLSQPAVTERVRKLESAGVITGYRAAVDPAALGYAIHAMVRVGRCDHAHMTRLADTLDEVVRAWNITGDDSWLIELVAVDVAHLDRVVNRLCELADTSTAIVLNVQHARRPLPPAGSKATG